MNTFLITFTVFGLAILAMAVGVILTGRRIQGSCGGLSSAVIGDDGEKRCSVCGITVEERASGQCDESSNSSAHKLM